MYGLCKPASSGMLAIYFAVYLKCGVMVKASSWKNCSAVEGLVHKLMVDLDRPTVILAHGLWVCDNRIYVWVWDPKKLQNELNS